MTELDRVKEKLVHAVRILDYLQIWEGNYGHVSCRLSDVDAICILGHFHDQIGEGMPLSAVRPDHMIVVNIETLEYEGSLEPPGEVFIHTELYRAREDVNAVVHAHPELPVALSIGGQPVLPVHYSAGLFHPSVPIFEDHRQIDNRERANEMIKVLDTRLAVVLRGHGATTVGESIEEAVGVMAILDLCAKRQYHAAQFGTPRPIKFSKADSRRLSKEYVKNLWGLYLNLAEERLG